MKKIVITGAGHGGIVAAIKLAKFGYEVTLFEKENEDSISYDWSDDIMLEVFEKTGIPCPPSECFEPKKQWRFISPDFNSNIVLPKPKDEISIKRREFACYLIDLAKEAGVNIELGGAVESLVFDGNNVVGIKVNGNEIKADLVIDASGRDSALREELVSKKVLSYKKGTTDFLGAYRAFYDYPFDAPEVPCELILFHNGEKGISWCNYGAGGEGDLLVARFGGLTDEALTNAIDDLKPRYEFLSENVRRDKKITICTRCSLPVFVTEGYAAVGDSAFMPMPLMGSGIESAMKAGAILADALKTDCDINALWEYEKEYYKQIGGDFVLIDRLKNNLLSKFDADYLNAVFASGIITSEDFNVLSTSQDAKLSKGFIGSKIKLAFKNWGLIRPLIPILVKGLKAKKASLKLPKKYNVKKIAKWQKRLEKTGY
ncbi:MAG: NAD(P)/FAD-dependent oxidoreductase [Eubacteriales bacterium]|nr:NAD(P)/FAD-dependent oxidoreductase [Eubacteriales bacterium]